MSRASHALRSPRAGGDVLELFVLAPDRGRGHGSSSPRSATRGCSRPFPRRGGEAGARWQRIIRAHERTLAFLEGRAPPRLPGGDASCARSAATSSRRCSRATCGGSTTSPARSSRTAILDVVLTSMIDWVADKPWELAFDPSRREFLATSCVNFVRNVFTAGPGRGARAPPGAAARAGRRSRAARRARRSPPRRRPTVRAAFAPLVARAARAEVESLTARDAGAAPAPARGGARRRAPLRRPRRLRRRDGARARSSWRTSAGRPRPLACRRVPADRLRAAACASSFLNACETARGGRSRLEPRRRPGARRRRPAGGGREPVLGARRGGDRLRRASSTPSSRGAAPLGDAAREARVAVGRDARRDPARLGGPRLFARDPRETLR